MAINLNADIERIQADINDMKKKYRAKVEEAARPIFAKAQAAMPEGVMLTWTQYTPHFMDGDECVFTVHDIFVVPIYGEDEDGYDYAEEANVDDDDVQAYIEYKAAGTITKHPYVRWSSNIQSLIDDIVEKVEAFKEPDMDVLLTKITAAREIASALAGLDDDIFEDAFGDHVEVKLTHDTCEAEEYSHD